MTDQPALTDDELQVWRSFTSMRRALDRALDLQLRRDSRVSASEDEVLVAIGSAADEDLVPAQ